MVVGSAAGALAQRWAPYVFAVGALAFVLMQLKQTYDGQNLTIRRLRRIMVVSDIFFLLAAALMFANQGNFMGLRLWDYLNYVHNNWVVALLAGAILQLYSTHRIGAELLVSERGVLLRKVDYMELYRIVDFQEHQSLLQQLCGLKTVRILSMDRNTPRLDLIGLSRRNDIVPQIRERVEYNKRKKGIYEITNH